MSTNIKVDSRTRRVTSRWAGVTPGRTIYIYEVSVYVTGKDSLILCSKALGINIEELDRLYCISSVVGRWCIPLISINSEYMGIVEMEDIRKVFDSLGVMGEFDYYDCKESWIEEYS